MTDIKEVGRRVFSIDDRLYSLPAAGAVYFLDGPQKALVDTGPATSLETVIEGIRQIGARPEEIDHIIITHIHLDHSGGAGTLLKYAPRARVIAHRRALKHLSDPGRLVASAIAAQGQRFVSTNGAVLPVPEPRLRAVGDGDRLDLGEGQVLTFLDCPGHAPHELCILESLNRGIFTGDAVGHYLDGSEIMVPITPPPSFDLDLFVATLKRLMGLHMDRIYFAHSGTSHQAQTRLESAMRKLIERENLIARAAAANQLDQAAEMVVNLAAAELGWVRENLNPVYNYWVNVDLAMSAGEHVRNYRKRHNLPD